LKPYAVTAENTHGREHPDRFTTDLTDPFAIDYHRVLHSTAFRRLKHKTQVFLAGQQDHFRTRMTHTLEVADVCRRLCAALNVNPAVGELVGLAHDLGHPPFGHAGEAALAELMTDHGGFEHNAQSLRVVEYLEHPYPTFRGLNLHYEIRESLAKHCTLYDQPGEHPLADGSRAPLEGQIANLADTIAYDCHDLEDALWADLVNEQELRQITLWREAADHIRQQFPQLPLGAVRRPILDDLETMLLTDIVHETQSRLDQAQIQSIDNLRTYPQDVVCYSPEMKSKADELNHFLYQRIYKHPRLAEMDQHAKNMVRHVFHAYLDNPCLLPPRFQNRIENQGRHLVVCDYVAGMTDHFCRTEYERLQ